MHKQILIVILSLVILIMVACESRPAPSTMKKCRCEQIPNILQLQAQMGREFTNEQFVDWIKTTYQVSGKNITITDNDEEILWKYDADFVWEKAKIEYRAEMRESVLVAVWIDYVKDPVPSAGCMAICLGPPEQYRAYYTLAIPGHALYFDMLFPNLGTMMYGILYFKPDQKIPPPITENFPITSIAVVLPGESEEAILRQIYHNNESYTRALDDYKLWPPKWEDIVIIDETDEFGLP